MHPAEHGKVHKLPTASEWQTGHGGGQPADKQALLCHLDVDVIDYARFPLADCPRYHGGLSLADTFDTVRAAARHPGLACLTLTEVNPGHDTTGELTEQLVNLWSAAIAEGMSC